MRRCGRIFLTCTPYANQHQQKLMKRLTTYYLVNTYQYQWQQLTLIKLSDVIRTLWSISESWDVPTYRTPRQLTPYQLTPCQLTPQEDYCMRWYTVGKQPSLSFHRCCNCSPDDYRKGLKTSRFFHFY